MRNCFLTVKTHSAAGPDNISGRTLKECSDSLAPVSIHLFQRSLDEGIIPSLWKTSTIVPMAKKPSPKEMNDYMPVAYYLPVALASIPFKYAEQNIHEATEGRNGQQARPPTVCILHRTGTPRMPY